MHYEPHVVQISAATDQVLLEVAVEDIDVAFASVEHDRHDLEPARLLPAGDGREGVEVHVVVSTGLLLLFRFRLQLRLKLRLGLRLRFRLRCVFLIRGLDNLNDAVINSIIRSLLSHIHIHIHIHIHHSLLFIHLLHFLRHNGCVNGYAIRNPLKLSPHPRGLR